MNHERTNIIALLILAVTTILFVACNSDGKQDYLQTQRLKVIDDSIEVKAPSTKTLIEQGMDSVTDSIEYYQYAARLSKFYVLSDTPDSALQWLNRIESFASTKSSPEAKGLMAYALNTRAGYYHNYHRNTQETLKMYEKSYELFMQSNDQANAPDVCANLGDAYVYENKLPEAASWYRRALFLSDSLNLPEKNNLSLYMGLALIYQQLGDNEKALNLYKRTDKHYREMQKSMQMYFINNYGGFFYYNKDYKHSLEQFKRMEKLLMDNGMSKNFDMYLCRLNLADVYLNLGDTKKAKEYIEMVEPFWIKNGDKVAIYYCNTIRLGIAVKENNIAEAEYIVKNTADDSNIIYNIRNIHDKYMRKYYELKGDWKDAYHNLANEVMESDSLEHNRINMRAADIIAQYSTDTLQLHKELTLEHKNAEVERMRLWLVVTISVVFVLILLLLVWIFRTHRNKLKGQMQIMNYKLETARNRISPHFIFNVLNNQIVSSDKEYADGLMNLTKLIRTNLDMAGQMTVTLEDEIDFVNKYVNVEKELLSDGQFEYNVLIDKDIDPKKTIIPSMFIQILTENAFVHGLMGRTGLKKLSIIAKHENGNLRITVADNGPGFDIRSSRGKRRTGLNIIQQTIAVINQHNKRKMRFEMHNRTDENNKIEGCNAILIIPDNIVFN